MPRQALEAAKALADGGIGIGMLHCATIKPLDEAAILSEADRIDRPAITLENMRSSAVWPRGWRAF